MSYDSIVYQIIVSIVNLDYARLRCEQHSPLNLNQWHIKQKTNVYINHQTLVFLNTFLYATEHYIQMA